MGGAPGAPVAYTRFGSRSVPTYSPTSFIIMHQPIPQLHHSRQHRHPALCATDVLYANNMGTMHSLKEHRRWQCRKLSGYLTSRVISITSLPSSWSRTLPSLHERCGPLAPREPKFVGIDVSDDTPPCACFQLCAPPRSVSATFKVL
jgi:hypothetical protein